MCFGLWGNVLNTWEQNRNLYLAACSYWGCLDVWRLSDLYKFKGPRERRKARSSKALFSSTSRQNIGADKRSNPKERIFKLMVTRLPDERWLGNGWNRWWVLGNWDKNCKKWHIFQFMSLWPFMSFPAVPRCSHECGYHPPLNYPPPWWWKVCM